MMSARAGYAWAAVCILLRSAASVCAKQAGLVSAGRAPAAVIVNPWYAAELAFLAVQAFAWVMVLRHLPLSLAYPLMALVLGVNLAAARLVFGETVSPLQIAAGMLILVGAALIAAKERA